jgi:hypothetical protein
MEDIGVSLTECNQPKGLKLKMRGYELRSGAYWQGFISKKA